MIKFSRRRTTPHDEQSDELLHNLLQALPPADDDPLRPVTLRSRTQQRRRALSRFRLRTWFDFALHRAEQLLTVALLAFFAFWLLDGYGRDWLYAHGYISGAESSPSQAYQQAPPVDMQAAQVLTDTTTLRTTSPTTSTFRIGGHPAQGVYRPDEAALPFTSPAMQATPLPATPVPDYISPRALRVSPVFSEQRPQRLIIPAIELDTPVKEVYIQDGIWQVADYAAGYHHGSAFPGEPGNTVMAGHAGLRGAVFRSLGALRAGDDVLLDAGDNRYRYRVREQLSVWPTQTEVMRPTETPVLTLITCTAWDTQRLVVIADLVDTHPL